MKPGYLVTFTDGRTALLFNRARAHGIAGHHGWTVKELTAAQAAARARATLKAAKATEP